MSMFKEKRIQKFVYDATTDIKTKNTAVGLGWLPANALITDGYAVVTTAFTDASGNATTISLGYTSGAAVFFPATACSVLTDNLVLKLIPGVINIGSGQAITTVDTPAEIVSASRVSGDTWSMIKTTATKEVLLTISDTQNIVTGRIEVYIEYVLSE